MSQSWRHRRTPSKQSTTLTVHPVSPDPLLQGDTSCVPLTVRPFPRSPRVRNLTHPVRYPVFSRTVQNLHVTYESFLSHVWSVEGRSASRSRAHDVVPPTPSRFAHLSPRRPVSHRLSHPFVDVPVHRGRRQFLTRLSPVGPCPRVQQFPIWLSSVGSGPPYVTVPQTTLPCRPGPPCTKVPYMTLSPLSPHTPTR